MNRVKNLAHVGIHESGESLLAAFETDAGAIELLFDLRTLETAIADLVAALSRPEVRQHQTTSGLLAAAVPKRTRVAPSGDGQAMLLSFQMPNGLEHHFALPNADASRIATQLQHKVSRQKSSTRNH